VLPAITAAAMAFNFQKVLAFINLPRDRIGSNLNFIYWLWPLIIVFLINTDGICTTTVKSLCG
jgi:hypothetical protein